MLLRNYKNTSQYFFQRVQIHRKQGRKRPLDTPKRKIEREREREREVKGRGIERERVKARGIERERESEREKIEKREDFSFNSS